MNTQLQAQTKAAPQPSFTPVQTGPLQRKCACGQHTIAGAECEECRQKREGMIQRIAMSAALVNGVSAIVHEALSSPGQPLDAGTRAFMEPRFGHDFSQVRVHTDRQAAQSAQAVNALAYTVGRDVVFGEGEYKPETSEGRRLLVHELMHVVQQRGTGEHLQQKLTISEPGDSGEHEAEFIANAVVSEENQPARSFTPVQLSLQRACGPREVGIVTSCTGLEGDIPGEGFRFVVNCDDFQPGEERRLRDFAATIVPGDILEIHGFASEEGPPVFNESLSCLRAEKARLILTSSGVPANQIRILYMHGATAGPRPERRSVVIDKLPGNAPERRRSTDTHEFEQRRQCQPRYDTGYSPSPANCSLYNSPFARRWLTYTYRHNAECACEETPNNPKNNCVRKCLQTKLSSFLSGLSSSGAVVGSCIDPFGILNPVCPEPYCSPIYDHHVDCYRECCCNDPFINYPTFLTMCEAPFFPCSFVGGTISWFNACL